ncbi:unnamed protein product [Rotaria sp. Silwood1]|nr:unnamed protein product [Rotaria sp. Silwood1]CAF4618602.1 unnamed protein product [Rotaria sp. Silwood1]
MKNKLFKISSLFTIAILFIATNSNAQVDRTKAPAPNAAPIIKIGTPAKFVLPNGLKVFVVQNNKLPRVSASLTFNYDPILEGDKAGYVSLAGELIKQGTTTKKKEVLDEEVDFLGANLSTSASSASVNALSSNFNKAFGLMADVVLHPAFLESEFDRLKKQTLTGLEAEKEDPNSISSNVSNKLMYGANHPYGEFNTEATVKNITLADVKKYYNTYWKPNVAYLVFVGDITPANAQKLALQYFGKWQKGVVPARNFVAPKPLNKPVIAIVDRPSSVQSNINIVSAINLKPGTADVIPSAVANSILGSHDLSSRLNSNLREKHAFTYGAYSNVNADRVIGNFTAGASVRNEKTDSAIQEFINEFNRLKKEAVDEKLVDTTKKLMSGEFALSLESPSTVARFALNTARYNLPADYYQNYLTNLSKVNAASVQQMANKYISNNNMYIVIVGNAKEIAKGLEKYGDVKYFDIYGNETKPSTTKAVDASITGKSIIEKYIAAVGGDAAIAAIKDAEIKGSAEIPGAPMKPDFARKYIVGSAYSSIVSAMGGAMVLQKQVVANGTYTSIQNGQAETLEDEDKEELDEETTFVNEVYYLKNNYTLNVAGIEAIDGKDVYAVKVKSAKGREFTNYYDVATGFKVKTTQMVDGPAGAKVPVSTMLGDYKAYNNVQMPTKVILDQGVKITVTFTDVKINSGLKVEDFK